MYSQLTGVLIPCAHPLSLTQSISVKIRFARPYWNKPVFSRPIRCGSRIGAKRNRHTLNFSLRRGQRGRWCLPQASGLRGWAGGHSPSTSISPTVVATKPSHRPSHRPRLGIDSPTECRLTDRVWHPFTDRAQFVICSVGTIP